jgi:subtilisin-like proprotein convertase family protein
MRKNSQPKRPSGRRKIMRSRATVSGVAALVAVLVVFAGVASAQERTTAPEGINPKATQVVTRTFSSANQIQINDAVLNPTPPPPIIHGLATPYPSKINVQGLWMGKIKDVNVTLKGYSHPFSDDTDVLLVAPTGNKNAIIFSDVGGNRTVSNINLTLDDEAANGLPDDPGATGTLPGNDTYTPANFALVNPDAFPAPSPAPGGGMALSVFDGSNPNGKWRLFVSDDLPGGTGQFSGGWSLKIKAKVQV